MLKDDIEKYTNLTGEDGWHVPIIKVGAYLDGYDKGLNVLDKIKAEIEEQVLESLSDGGDDWFVAEKVNECLEIIDKYKAEREDKE